MVESAGDQGSGIVQGYPRGCFYRPVSDKLSHHRPSSTTAFIPTTKRSRRTSALALRLLHLETPDSSTARSAVQFLLYLSVVTTHTPKNTRNT